MNVTPSMFTNGDVRYVTDGPDAFRAVLAAPSGATELAAVVTGAFAAGERGAVESADSEQAARREAAERSRIAGRIAVSPVSMSS
jgi:hypothetical protein